MIKNLAEAEKLIDKNKVIDKLKDILKNGSIGDEGSSKLIRIMQGGEKGAEEFFMKLAREVI